MASSRSKALRPARTIFYAFAAATVLGTLLLWIPIASQADGSADFMDCLFTATSALCVTGLITVDTVTHWTPFGQAVILGLIQLGGFGVMTFASVIGIAVARRLSFRSRMTAAAEANVMGADDVRSLVIGVVRISFIFEFVVAVILTLRFAITYDEPLPRAIWLGVFHSVSSFNNAGFALFSDNMMSFVSDPVINLAMCAAIIFGGLGFPVIMQLRKHLRCARLWSMNTRLVLVGTLVLLLSGWIYITAIEWDNPDTFGPLSWHSKLLAGFFLSVQTRTAGFNNIDIGAMDHASQLGMDVLMIIGGGPAGTAGGIKVTTFLVLFFIVLAEIRGDDAVNIFGKRLSRAAHRQAISVAAMAIGLIITCTAAIMIMTPFTLDQALFEVTSAFGTVGLSTGITASLPVPSQFIIIMLMFIGRLGPITFASALAFKDNKRAYVLPKERPIIG